MLYFANIFTGLLTPFLWNNLAEYQKQRILTFLNPDLDPMGSAYHIIQSITAIGSGGFFGKGWGEGSQTQLKFLPVQESDFILSFFGARILGRVWMPAFSKNNFKKMAGVPPCISCFLGEIGRAHV